MYACSTFMLLPHSTYLLDYLLMLCLSPGFPEFLPAFVWIPEHTAKFRVTPAGPRLVFFDHVPCRLVAQQRFPLGDQRPATHYFVAIVKDHDERVAVGEGLLDPKMHNTVLPEHERSQFHGGVLVHCGSCFHGALLRFWRRNTMPRFFSNSSAISGYSRMISSSNGQLAQHTTRLSFMFLRHSRTWTASFSRFTFSSPSTVGAPAVRTAPGT